MFDVVVSVSLKYHSKRVRKKCLKCFYTMFLKPAQYLLSAWINLKWQFCWEDIPNCINIRTLSCMNIFNVSMVVSLSNCFFFWVCLYRSHPFDWQLWTRFEISIACKSLIEHVTIYLLSKNTTRAKHFIYIHFHHNRINNHRLH